MYVAVKVIKDHNLQNLVLVPCAMNMYCVLC